MEHPSPRRERRRPTARSPARSPSACSVPSSGAFLLWFACAADATGSIPLQTRLSRRRCAAPLDSPSVAVEVSEAELQHPAPGKPRLCHRRPLDEGDRAGVEVVVEQRRILVLEAAEPVEIEMGDRQATAVAPTDREGGRGDRALDPERPAGPADQRRLARAQLAADDDHVAGAEAGGDPRAGGFGFGSGAALDRLHAQPNMSSWSAGGCGGPGAGASSISSGADAPGGGPASSRGSSSKSSRSVSFTAGVRNAAAGWKSGTRKTVRPPSAHTCGVPLTLVIPVGSPLSSLVAKLPRVQTTRGSISRTCSNR